MKTKIGTCSNIFAVALIMWLGMAGGVACATVMTVNSWNSYDGRRVATFANTVNTSFEDSIRFSLSSVPFGDRSSSHVNLKHDAGITFDTFELWGDGKFLRYGSKSASDSHLSFLGDSNTKDYELRFKGFNKSGTGGYCGEIVVSPVPEPQTYAMLLIGLGLIGFSARRRNDDTDV